MACIAASLESRPPEAGTLDLGPRGGAGSARLIFRLALALALLPLVVSAVVLVVHASADYHPFADIAVTELVTRDVGHHPVLVGLYSRDGWNHPGPALFYLLALPYRLSGSASIGINLGALLINGLAIAGMALVARRRGGTPLLLLTLVGCGLLVRALGPVFMRDPWNPWIPVLPFGLVVFLSWAMTCGDTWALPVAAGVASFCAQTHIGYVALALPLLVWGTAWLVTLAYRGAGPRGRDPPLRSWPLVRAVLIATAVLVVMWLPPLMQELLHSSNLTQVAQYFADPPNPAHSLGEGYRVVFGQFGLSAPWLSGAGYANPPFAGEPDLLRSAPLPVLLLPFGMGALALWRWRHSDACRLVATLAMALGLGVLAVAGTIGPLWDYRLQWTRVLAMVATVVVAWAAWLLISGRNSRAEARWLVPVSVAAWLVVAGVTAVGAVRAPAPTELVDLGAREPWSRYLAATVPSVVAALPKRDGDVIVRCDSDNGCLYSMGLMLALERRGIAARSEHPAGANVMGRLHRRGRVRAALHVAVKRLDAMLNRPDVRLVAYWGALPRQERTRLLRQLAALDARHEARTIDDFAYYVERVALTKRLPGTRTGGVFIEPFRPGV